MLLWARCVVWTSLGPLQPLFQVKSFFFLKAWWPDLPTSLQSGILMPTPSWFSLWTISDDRMMIHTVRSQSGALYHRTSISSMMDSHPWSVHIWALWPSSSFSSSSWCFSSALFRLAMVQFSNLENPVQTWTWLAVQGLVQWIFGPESNVEVHIWGLIKPEPKVLDLEPPRELVTPWLLDTLSPKTLGTFR